MRHLKMIGLGAVAALAMMAFVGAGSASASATQIQSEGEPYSGSFKGLGTSTFLSSFMTFSCHFEMTGSTKSNGLGEITGAKWTNCTLSECNTGSMGPNRLPWHTTALPGSKLGNGTFHILLPGHWFQCDGVKCEYETLTATINLVGGTPATIGSGSGIPLAEGPTRSFLCPNTATWHVELEVTQPANLTIHLI